MPPSLVSFHFGRRRRGAALAVAVVVAALATTALAASEPMTIAAQPPDLLRNRLLTLYGSIPSDVPREIVRLEARDCGQSYYREVARVETSAGGRWSWSYFYPGITASVRARWDGRASVPVRVRDRAYVELRQTEPGRTFAVSVRAKLPFLGRRVQFQRFDPARGWKTLTTVTLAKRAAPAGTPYVYSTARFTAPAPAGSLVRAYFPLAQARPCYLAGRSNLLRVG